MKKQDLERLFRTYYMPMYRLARTYLYDEEESKDAVSEVFATLLYGNTELMPGTERTYLLTAIRNRCMNILAHKQIEEQVAGLLIADRETLTVAEDNERLDRLMHFIDTRLPSVTQRIFRLRHLEERSYSEIADDIGVSKVTVYNHLASAMELIKEFFGKQKQQL